MCGEFQSKPTGPRQSSFESGVRRAPSPQIWLPHAVSTNTCSNCFSVNGSCGLFKIPALITKFTGALFYKCPYFVYTPAIAVDRGLMSTIHAGGS